MTDQNDVIAAGVELKLLGDACNEVRRVGRLVVVEYLGDRDLHALCAQGLWRRPPHSG